VLDPLLEAFIAADGAEADRHLAVLVDRHAAPLARAIASRRLRDYAAPSRGDDDVNDAVNEALTLLVDRLRTLHAARGSDSIAAFRSFVAATTRNVCARHVRVKHPGRARLKDRLRYALESSPALAVWRDTEDVSVCGLAAWRGRAADAAARAALERLAEAGDDRLAMPAVGAQDGALAAALTAIFTGVAGPVELDRVAGILATANHLDARDRDVELDMMASAGPGADVTVAQRNHLQHVWREIGELPVRQRHALLLGLREAAGEQLLWLLPVTGVASVREIARVLEIPAESLAAVWRALPLDDRAIATRLDCSRQQVINLRMSARKRLANRMAALTGNLRRVSPSYEGET
jgi:hypothetical protein